MRVCYFGKYDPDYSRNRILIKGLRANGVTVIESRTEAKGFFNSALDLWRKHKEINGQYDVMIVGFLGQLYILVAKLLTRKPIVLDAFMSLYDTNVLDRKADAKYSPRAIYSWLLDWLSCRLADGVLLDTQANIDFFVKTFGLPAEKFRRIFVGSDEEMIFPLSEDKVELSRKDKNYFLVHFHGTFIPLHGIEYIVGAAKILEKEDINFLVIGRGQTYRRIKAMIEELNLKNFELIDPVPYANLKNWLAKADLCLGIFGQTNKAHNVIPNKAFEIIAAKRPLLTGDSKAARELFTNGVDVVFCRMGDAVDLAVKILELKNNFALRQKIAENGHLLFQSRLKPAILGKQLADIVYELTL